MLTELSIRNYALIDSLKLEFDKGLNVLTGETGAGKSIIVVALSLLLGEKASGPILKKDAARCEIAGVFNLSKNNPARNLLDELSLENSEDGETLYLRREVDLETR